MIDEDRQTAAAVRVFDAARALYDEGRATGDVIGDLGVALQLAYAAGIPRPSLARITGLSSERVTEFKYMRARRRPAGTFAGVLELPPYTGPRPQPRNPEKRRPGSPGAVRAIAPDRLDHERRQLRAVRSCIVRGLSIRETAAELGMSRSVVGRYVKTLRSLPLLGRGT